MHDVSRMHTWDVNAIYSTRKPKSPQPVGIAPPMQVAAVGAMEVDLIYNGRFPRGTQLGELLFISEAEELMQP